MTIHYGPPGALDFDALVQQMPDDEFKNLTRSTIPSLCWWSEALHAESARWEPLRSALELSPLATGQLCFEYQVKSYGRNKPSFTDAMFISDGAAVAFEAKSTERVYENVEKWLREKEDSANAQGVLRHWLDMIGSQSDPLSPKKVGGCVYQMLHRTASVCSLRKDSRRLHVVHQIFQVDDVDHEQEYREALKEFEAALGATQRGISIWLACVKTRRTEKFQQVSAEITSLPPDAIPMPVRQAVIAGGLFTFDPCVVEQLKS